LPVKCRLDKSPLPAVKVVLARKKALTQETLGQLEPATLMKGPIIRYQDVLDRLRIVEQMSMKVR
jgi:hypothetical protein